MLIIVRKCLKIMLKVLNKKYILIIINNIMENYSEINFKQNILDEKPQRDIWQTVSPQQQYNNSLTKINNQWAQKSLNYDGVKPPTPNILPATTNKKNEKSLFDVYQIESRDPYRVQYLINGYGGHQSGLGTNLGM